MGLAAKGTNERGRFKRNLNYMFTPFITTKDQEREGARLRSMFILHHLVVLVRKPCGSSQQLKAKGVEYYDEGTRRENDILAMCTRFPHHLI